MTKSVTATKERTRTTTALADLVRAWPNQTEAAELIGIDPSTLLRRNLPYEEFGGREKRFAPRVVLSEARYYRRVPVQEVAARLYEIALERTTKDEAKQIAADADAYLNEQPDLHARALSREQFLAEARRELPRKVYRQVEATYRQTRHRSLLANAVTAGAGTVPALIRRAQKRRHRPA